jgi:periplasmic protein TonB
VATELEQAPRPDPAPATGRRLAARKRKKTRYVPVIIVGLGVITIASGAVALVRTFLNSAPNPPKQVIQTVQLIRPPPPPPDLPPPPPPPPEEKVDMQEPQKQPDPTPSNQPPPSQQLGLDAAGSAGADAFGLAARPGGRDITAVGGSAYLWYAGIMKNDILSLLQDDPEIRNGAYTVSVRLWLKSDGTVQRFKLAQSTGDKRRDRELEKRLSQLSRISQPPPADTPEPITIEIVTHT